MSDNEQYKVNFVADFSALAKSAKEIANLFGNMNTTLGGTDKAMNKVEKDAAQLAASLEKVAKVQAPKGDQYAAQAKGLKALSTEAEKAYADLRKLSTQDARSAYTASTVSRNLTSGIGGLNPGTGQLRNDKGQFQKFNAKDFMEMQLAAQKSGKAVGDLQTNLTAAGRTAADTGQRFTSLGAAFAGQKRASEQLTQQTRDQAAAWRDLGAAQLSGARAGRSAGDQMIVNNALINRSTKASKEAEQGIQGLANARYALFDVARALTVVSVATLGVGVAAIKTAADYEKLFAQVERTSQLDGQAFVDLKNTLIDLTTVMPATIADITSIATLAGQLGIASDAIDEFTEVVGMFAASTNVTATAAAEKLGRIAQLAGVAAADYEKLASAVYQTGITSVATEDDILSVTQQISVSGRQAGFAAEQTIALASALASLGVAPERARGSIQRVFNEITKAVDNGGAKLEQFAALSQMSSDKFAGAWKTDAQGAFLAFVEGLGAVGDAGGNANQVLADLGITAVRDTDALKRLAQNTEVYTQAIYESTTAFEEGTALQDGYAITADTLSAKVSMLASSVKALMANAQDNTALKVLADVLLSIARGLVEISKTPFGATLMTLVTAVTIFTGVIAAMGAGLVLALASVFAFITALNYMATSQTKSTGVFHLASLVMKNYLLTVKGLTPAQYAAAASGNKLAASFRLVGAAAGLSANAIRGIKYALASTGILAAVAIIGSIIDTVWQKIDAANTKTETFTTNLQGLGEALAKDTKNIAEGTDVALVSFNVTLDESGTVMSEAEATAANYSNAMNRIWDNADGATGALKKQTLQVGKLTKEWIAQNLIEGTSGEQFLQDLASLKPYFERAGLDINKAFTDAIAGKQSLNLDALRVELQNQVTMAERELDAIQLGSKVMGSITGDEVLPVTKNLQEALAAVQASKEVLANFDSVVPALGSVNDMLKATVAQGEGMKILYSGLGLSMDDYGDSVEGATDDLSKFLDTNLATADAVVGLRNNLFALGGTIAENGTSLDRMTAAGRANYDAIRASIDLLYKQAGGNTDIFDASLNNLLNMLQHLGFANNELLVFRKLLSGNAISFQNMQVAGMAAGNALEDGFNTATDAIQETGDAAEEVIRTLDDYVSDLSSTMQAAFDFRYGFQQAADALTTAYAEIAEAAEEAKKRVRDLKVEVKALRATLAGLKASATTLKYQLSVALEYGDVLRAAEIQADLNENKAEQQEVNNDLKDTNEELADAQDAATASTQGNSAAAIAQRAALMGLVGNIQDAITAYAAAGHSQAEVQAYAKQLKAQLAAQLKAWGYNSAEIATYTQGIDDFVTIVAQIPRDLTVEVDADTDPAKVALDAFMAKNKNKHISVTVGTSIDKKGMNWATKKMALYVEYMAAASRYQTALNPYNPEKVAKYGAELHKKRLAYENYYTGGYTGPGGKYAPAGVVHKGEFVFDQKATRFFGPGYLYSMMNAAKTGRGFAQGGPVSYSVAPSPSHMIVEFGPASMAAVRAGGNVTLILDGKDITNSVNNHNGIAVKRGQG